eukprot:tig00000430_g628.t1
MRIGIVGFGNFGQFLAARFRRHAHDVIATSRQDYADVAKELGVSFTRDMDEFCRMQPDCVVLSPSILSLEKVFRSMRLDALHDGKRATRVLFVDVLSVKVFPKQFLSKELPAERFDLLCCHPMFGPQSGKDSWRGLPMVYENVRVEGSPYSAAFLKIFEDEGCSMVEMSCEEHDRQAASSQFITHTVGRMLEVLNPPATQISTRGYEQLRGLMENTCRDSFDLYYGLYKFNPNATAELERMEAALRSVRKRLEDEKP